MNIASVASRLSTVGGPRVQTAVGVINKHSPQILTAVGLAGGVTAAVLGAKATLKLPDLLDNHEMGRVIIQERSIDPETSERQTQKDTTYLYARTGLDLVKLYGPAASIGVASVVCIVAAQGINAKRQVALVAALKSAETAFQTYRARVIEAIGEDKEAEIRYGIKKETVVGEDGKKSTVKTVDMELPDAHMRWFLPNNPNWQRGNRELNLYFLNNVQDWANDRLNARGYLFLNEVYSTIGVPESPEGQILGWLADGMKGSKDGYVDFNLSNIVNEQIKQFKNGTDDGILIDFNYDGEILSKLGASDN